MTRHPINEITVQTPVTVQNLTIFPLSLSQTGGPAYIPSSVAIEQHGLVVTEVDDGGSVPNLLVENPSSHCVLFLDGEELRGAKQNRVVNTTLLLAARSKTVIPVSCSEQGRWSYSSPTFSHSKTVMPAKARRRKNASVTFQLDHNKVFDSDQGEVWSEVDALHEKVGSHSNTSAMSDAFEKMREDLDAAIDQIRAVEGQFGLIAMINGKPSGLDLLSRSDVYAELHSQLVQSYAMEALANPMPVKRSKSKGQMPPIEPADGPAPDLLLAKAFLERCAAIKGKSYPSIALGTDWRFSEGPVVGSGLEAADTWVHMAYFLDEPEADGPHGRRGKMARASQRSRYRRADPNEPPLTGPVE